MKTITFFGSGVERENVKSEMPEIRPVIERISRHYDEFRFGGTNIGLLGKVGEEALEHGLKVTPILPKWLAEEHEELVFSEENLILTDHLAERKRELSKTDAILCYPGGVGTFDEIFDVLARISMGEMDPVPVIIYNYERFYSPLLLQVEHGVKTGTIKEEVMDHIHTFEQIETLEQILEETE